MPKEKVEAKQSFVHDDINAHKGQLLELTESQAAALRKAGLVGDPAAKPGPAARAAGKVRTTPQNKMAMGTQNKAQQTPASSTDSTTAGAGGDSSVTGADQSSDAGAGDAGRGGAAE